MNIELNEFMNFQRGLMFLVDFFIVRLEKGKLIFPVTLYGGKAGMKINERQDNIEL